MDPTDTIPAFDAFLAARGIAFEAVIIGGSALVLLGVVQRTTDDCDVLDPNIPEAVLHAARDFGSARGIAEDWLVALVDRGTDYADCIALAPTLEELQAAWPFIAQYEGNAESREHYGLPLARKQLARLGKELGYDALF